jgi:hypothetical protein
MRGAGGRAPHRVKHEARPPSLARPAAAAPAAPPPQGYLRSLSSKREAWKSWPGQAPLVSAVTFATPNIGDAEFVAHLDTTLNARNIE